MSDDSQTPPDRPSGPAGPDGVPQAIFHEAYTGRAPWDVAHPQQELLRLVGADAVEGDVLDLGCGTGENALHLAARGHRVFGVDLVPRAIEAARAKAAARGLAESVRFEAADALALELGETFDTVLDSGVFHVFSDAERPVYRRAVARHLRPGGRLHILCFSERQPGGGPRRVTRRELREIFGGPGWRVEAIVPTRYDTVDGPKEAWRATAVRLPRDRTHASSASPFEAQVGFSRAVRVDDRILVAGTAPIGRDGQTVHGDAEVQARRCLEIIIDAIEQLGGTAEDVVRTRMYLTDRADADAVSRAHAAFFGHVRPAATQVIASGLLDPAWKVEIEAEALLPHT